MHEEEMGIGRSCSDRSRRREEKEKRFFGARNCVACEFVRVCAEGLVYVPIFSLPVLCEAPRSGVLLWICRSSGEADGKQIDMGDKQEKA